MLPIVTLDEKLLLDQKIQTGHFTEVYRSSLQSRRETRNMVIERNAADDTFNISIPPQTNLDGDWHEAPYVNINNKYEFANKSSIIGQVNPAKITNDSLWRVHHTLLGNMPFRDVSVAALGTDTVVGEFDNYRFTNSRRIAQFDFPQIQKSHEYDFSKIIELKTIKSVSFENNKDIYSTFVLDDRQQPHYEPSFQRTTQVDFKYTHLFIKPTDPDRFHGNETVAEIYGYVDGGGDLTDGDYDIKDGTMKSSSIGNEKLNLFFDKYTGEKKYLESGLPQYLLGTLKVSDPTYYDYSSGTTKIGFAANSTIGETIPFSFKGDYERELDVTFNSAFKGMKLGFSKHLGAAVLDPSEGDVKLNVATDNHPKHATFKTFTPEDIELIRSKKLDLVGLERLSEDE